MRCRKEVRDLTAQEKQDFVDAVWELKRNGTYDQYVSDHAQAMNQPTPAPSEDPDPDVRNAAHRGPAFLPWHREFLRRFEEDLRAEVDGVTIPYWDWTIDAGMSDPTSAPVWDDDLMGGDGDSDNNNIVMSGPFSYEEDGEQWWIVDTNGNRIEAGDDDPISDPGLQRALGEHGALRGRSTNLGTDSDVMTAQNLTPYDEAPWNRDSDSAYRNVNEGWAEVNGKREPNLHNLGHVFVGGDMLPSTSPNDPVFFLHHCFVDKMWADWQRQHPSEDYVPTASHTDAPDGHRLNDSMYPWSTTPADVLDHHALGYRYDTDPLEVTPQTSTITFNDVPEGETTTRAAVFSVGACDPVQLEITSGPSVTSGPGSFGTPLGTTTTVQPDETEGRLWISYTGTNPGDTANGSVTVRCLQTGETWSIPITVNTIARPTVAVDLVLDKSGSMQRDSGVETPGGSPQSRMEVLQYSAPVLVNLLEADDGIGVVSFDTDAQNETPDVKQAGAVPAGTGRNDASNAISSLTPGGSTSIGDGVARANSRLSGVTGYDETATVVFTDGHENEPQYINNISSLISDRVFAIGMGTPEQLRPAALQSLADGTGGFLMMTDELDSDDDFRLSKYFLQVLSGVKNTDIVVDPEDRLPPDTERRVPFHITEADISADIVVLAPGRNVFDMALETPDGDVIDAGMASGLPELSYRSTDVMSYYRLNLPLSVGAGAHAGEWSVLLSVNEKGYRRFLERIEETDQAGYPVVETHGPRYNVSVQTRSNLRLSTSLSQDSREPGATVTVRSRLTEYDLPVDNRASVQMEVIAPDSTHSTHSLSETEPGVFETTFSASQSGAYRCRVRGTGRTLRGRPFTREQLVTGSVWNGGDQPAPSTGDRHSQQRVCRLLECLINEAFPEVFEEMGVDRGALQECIGAYCEEVQSHPERAAGEHEHRETESVNIQRLLSDRRIRQALNSISEATREMQSLERR